MKLQLLSLLALAHRGYAAIAVAPPQPADHKHDDITYEQHSSSQIKLLQTPQFETAGYNQASCNKWPNDYVCACDGNLGIKYGHCYTMTDINGLQLNRDTGGTYQSGGDIGNLIFRVNLLSPSFISIQNRPGTERMYFRSANPPRTATNHMTPLSLKIALGSFRTSSGIGSPRARAGSRISCHT